MVEIPRREAFERTTMQSGYQASKSRCKGCRGRTLFEDRSPDKVVGPLSCLTDGKTLDGATGTDNWFPEEPSRTLHRSPLAAATLFICTANLPRSVVRGHDHRQVRFAGIDSGDASGIDQESPNGQQFPHA